MEIVQSQDGLTVGTSGLRGPAGEEISATVHDASLTEACREFILYVADYIRSGHPIAAGETLSYGYWITKAVETEHGVMSFWEYAAGASDFVPGVSQTVRFWSDQHSVCELAKSVFLPPQGNQLVVISDGVMQGKAVQGVRYPSPTHMSGWWITSDCYNGDLATLKTIHAYHLTATRPDLARYLALSNGFRFYSATNEIRFDPKAMA